MNRRTQRFSLVVLAVAGVVIGTALALGARPLGVALGAFAASPTPTRAVAPTAVRLNTAQPTSAPVEATVAAPTPAPTHTPAPATTAPPTQTATSAGPCALYGQIQPDLLTYVDREVGLDRDFEPPDLEVVPLDKANMAYQPVSLRTVVHQPLLEMLAAMNEAGLSPWVMSGYRSYSDQTLAYEKWLALYPDRAAEISAAPGHSEHQLGTVVDLTTRAMVDLYGDFFNVKFSQTAEGQWLQQHALAYGFTLSYPPWGVEQTGYAWEPWHFRYVGGLAPELSRLNLTLTQYLQQCGREGQ